MAEQVRRLPAKSHGLTILDVTALVLGAAIASVHARPAFIQQTSVLGRSAIVLAFLAVTLTASGPFLRLNRRWIEGAAPEPGDDVRYWSALGLPWIVAALVRTTLPWARVAVQGILLAGLMIASGSIIIDLWRSQVRLNDRPHPTEPDPAQPVHWTSRVGAAMAVSWPLQFACGLMIQDQT